LVSSLVNNLREFIGLDPNSHTGLVWLSKTSPRVNIKIGLPAFTAKDNKGYFKGSLNGHQLYAHVVVFYLTHGYRPKVVDHIDGDTTNNAPDNLRASTTSENAHNMLCRGYSKHSCGKWRACIRANGKDVYLGLFPTESEAKAAYLAAKVKLHPTAPSRCFYIKEI